MCSIDLITHYTSTLTSHSLLTFPQPPHCLRYHPLPLFINPIRFNISFGRLQWLTLSRIPPRDPRFPAWTFDGTRDKKAAKTAEAKELAFWYA